MPDSWTIYEWKAHPGYSALAGKTNGNAERERIWFSPACRRVDDQMSLLELMTAPQAAE
jgi:hypothetical protein